MGEADRQQALALGSDRPERAWILTDRDVWHANPFYHGEPVPHPEWDGDSLHNPPIALAPEPAPVLAPAPEDDIPF